jgi:hypothetical protein
MHPRGVQDRYFNSLRNRIKMGTVVSAPTARRASPALRRSSFSRALLSRRPIPTPSAPRVIAINPISGNVKVMRFALMFIYLLHTFDSHPVSAAVRRATEKVTCYFREKGSDRHILKRMAIE